ncbi:MAG TPA: sigma-54 dependent transcriptional regulator [bacterium]|nr:sigma-54 dependent transcriptional regulator [bacterium]HPR87898.1 sigma-54 dependent transcriptional regulator [bacterium]
MGDKKASDRTILVIDDDRSELDSLVRLLKKSQYSCLTAMNAEDGIRLYARERPMIVLSDMRMPANDDGIRVLEEVRRIDPEAVVILYTGYGSIPNVVEAFKKGAFDYIQKVQTHIDILQPIERALKFARMQHENAYLRSRLDLTDNSLFYGAVGSTPVMLELFEKARRIALTNASVMIVGETGTGKDVIARGIHYHSQRRDESFVPVAVGALPDNLLEGELFGHVKGAFTGATIDKAGLFEAADKGTIFLDEISEVSFDLQHKLLRVLQDHKVRRLGSLKEREVDVRVISATNQEPDYLVREKRLREDLFYRLQVIRLSIPPLRERREDIPLLVYHFLRQYRHYGPIEVEKISSDALLAMQQYNWPGNVRQLQHAIEHMVTMAQKSDLELDDLPEDILPRQKKMFVQVTEDMDFKQAKAVIIAQWEKQYIETLLDKYKTIAKVAKVAGLNRKTIYRLIEHHKIKWPRHSAAAADPGEEEEEEEELLDEEGLDDLTGEEEE